MTSIQSTSASTLNVVRSVDNYCRNCGRPNVGHYNYCPNCGTNLSLGLTAKPQNTYSYSYIPPEGQSAKLSDYEPTSVEDALCRSSGYHKPMHSVHD